MIPVVLAVGALDPLGTDGILADMRTAAALGAHGAAATTWAGGATGPAEVRAQVDAVLAAAPPAAVKLGALGTAATMRAVADALTGCPAPVVADPSLAALGGQAADATTVAAWREAILPLSTVATPNLAEAALLTGTPRAATRGDMRRQGEALLALGCRHVIVSGGHGSGEKSIDILVTQDRPPLEMWGDRLDRGSMRGLSGTLAAAIAAHLALGLAAFEAIQAAKLFLSTALAATAPLGGEDGPRTLHQLHRLWRTPSHPWRQDEQH